MICAALEKKEGVLKCLLDFRQKKAKFHSSDLLDKSMGGLANERKGEQPRQRQRLWISEAAGADGHTLMACFRLWAIGAKETVPSRKIKTKITVVFFCQNGMVNPVHIRRDHKKSHHLVHSI